MFPVDRDEDILVRVLLREAPMTSAKLRFREYELDPDGFTLVRAGHRIRLEIANGDSAVTDAVFTHPYPPTAIGTDTFHHEAAHPSRIKLPVVASS